MCDDFINLTAERCDLAELGGIIPQKVPIIRKRIQEGQMIIFIKQGCGIVLPMNID